MIIIYLIICVRRILAEQKRSRSELEPERARLEGRVAEQDRARLAEHERERSEAFRTLQIQVEQLAERERIRAANVDNIPPATGQTSPPPGAYIPDDRLVRLTTSYGMCPILADDDEVLYRPSMDCNHFLGAAALSQYLEGSANSGPFPIRCPSCLANNPTSAVGIITESPLHCLVAAGVITNDLQRRILLQHIRLEPDQASLEFLYATSKACPFCSIRISHYRGHACHHIKPGDGCPSCHNHFCYNCLGYRGDGSVWQGCTNGCPLFCDDTCSCTDCPDCQPGFPCIHCSFPNMTQCRVCAPR